MLYMLNLLGGSKYKIYIMTTITNVVKARRQKFSEGGAFDTAGGLGAAQGSQKPLGIWCKIL